MNAERPAELDLATRKKLFILEKLKDEYDLYSPSEKEPMRLHWSIYDKWIAQGGIDSYDQFNRILLGLQKDGFLIKHQWVNPAM